MDMWCDERECPCTQFLTLSRFEHSARGLVTFSTLIPSSPQLICVAGRTSPAKHAVLRRWGGRPSTMGRAPPLLGSKRFDRLYDATVADQRIGPDWSNQFAAFVAVVDPRNLNSYRKIIEHLIHAMTIIYWCRGHSVCSKDKMDLSSRYLQIFLLLVLPFHRYYPTTNLGRPVP